MSEVKIKLSTADILDELGYDFYRFTTPPEKPEYSSLRFADILPELLNSSSERCRRIAHANLYKHQEEALEVLRRGRNLILKSGTGSGKTEAWFLYTATEKVKTLAIYPTLALANDQLNRLNEYSNALGLRILALDAGKKEGMLKTRTVRELRREVYESDIVITNPAFLLNELKKLGAGRSGVMSRFLEEARLLVVDDFDFYGPRSIAMLVAMVKIMTETISPGLQLAFITAALENEEEVAVMLSEINGRETSIVSGKAFHPENITYVVLGKSLRKTWEELRKYADRFREAGAGKDVMEALENYELFKKNYFKVVDVARASGISLPEESVDVASILARYVGDDGVTLVFTRGIAGAEELARRVALKLNDDRLVASHHHLLLKSQREEVEERTRRGEVKVIISPRTLSQGIDIGLVKRIVHVGLPESVREFRQREGRKGRRPEIGVTETVIIPRSLWDRDLLSRGVEALRKWIELPGEKVLVNKHNLYIKLFESLYRLVSSRLRETLSREDYSFLENLGLVRNGELTKTGKNTWIKMNFYEFAPAYGIKRLRITETGRLDRLEDISHVDLVEKFQIGCIDYSSDGIVVEHKLGGKTSRVVTAVVVDDISERVMRKHDSLAYVLEEYEKLKHRWGEIPSIRRDYFNGKLHTEVQCVVHAPSRGFGLYTKIPNRIEWRILSDRKRIEPVGDRTVVYRERKTLEVPTPTNGIYNDYTYGISFEVEPSESVELLRLGLAFIVIMMRRLLGVAFDTVKYDIMVLGERKVVGMHETESAGLLVKLDWSRFAKMIEEYEPDELDEIFMEEVDEIAYSSLIALRIDWSVVKKQALKIIDYIRLQERLTIKLGELEIEIPKPSRANKIASISVADITLREDTRSGVYAVAVYDGEESVEVVGFRELGEPDEEAGRILGKLSQLANTGFTLAVYDGRDVENSLSSAGLDGLRALLIGLRGMEKVLEVRSVLSELLGERITLDSLEEALGLDRRVEIREVMFKAEERRRKKLRDIRRGAERLAELLREFVKQEAENIYKASLIAKKLQSEKVEQFEDSSRR